MENFIGREEINKMRTFRYIIFFLFSCNETQNNIHHIKYIVLKDYEAKETLNPILVFYNSSHNVDTNYYHWSFEILSNENTLNNIYKESKLFKNNLPDTSYKNWCHVEVFYDNEKKIDTIEIPMEKGVDYFDLLIKILEENKVKDLDIAVKKLNYMKD